MADDDSETLARLLTVSCECTASRLRHATRAITRVYDGAMAKAGVEGTQFSVLVAVSLLGNASIGELAERLGVDRTTVTRNLGPLERKRWIETSGEADRRVRRVRLSARGRRVVAETLPIWERTQARVVKALGRSEWSALMTLLASVAELRT